MRRRTHIRPGDPPPLWLTDVEAGRAAMRDGAHGVHWPGDPPPLSDAAVSAWQRDRRRLRCTMETGCWSAECSGFGLVTAGPFVVCENELITTEMEEV